MDREAVDNFAAKDGSAPIDVGGDESEGRHVEDGLAEETLETTRSVRKGETEVEEESWSEEASNDIAPIDNLVKGVELAGVMETGVDERAEAEKEEMPGLGCAFSPEIDKEANAEVGEANGGQVVEGTLGTVLLYSDCLLDFNILFVEVVVDSKPSLAKEKKGDVARFLDLDIANAIEDFPAVDTRAFAGGAFFDVESDDEIVAVGRSTINPHDAISGEDIRELLAEVYGCGDERSYCQDDE